MLIATGPSTRQLGGQQGDECGAPGVLPVAALLAALRHCARAGGHALK